MSLAFWQPHWRLVYALILGLIISAIHRLDWLIWLNLVGLLVCLFSLLRTPILCKTYAKRWLTLNLFTLLIWFTLSWQIGKQGVQFNPQGIQLASLISLRMNLIFFALWLCLSNMNEILLVQAISKLPLPSKLIHLVILTVRYIAVLRETNQRIERAMRARGYQNKFGLFSLKVNAQRVALLLMQAYVKVEKSEMALKARGFRFQGQPSLLDKPQWKWLERAVIFLFVFWIYWQCRS